MPRITIAFVQNQQFMIAMLATRKRGEDGACEFRMKQVGALITCS
jgi:hypothetical protein